MQAYIDGSNYMLATLVVYVSLSNIVIFLGEIMIFFGTKGKVIQGEPIETEVCSSCGKYEHQTFGILRYIHLYWIPLIPISKKVGTECIHCKKTLVGKEVPKEISKQIKPTIFTMKKVLPSFSGLIIIACLILFGFFSIQQKNAQDAAYIQNPQVNDIYIVNFQRLFKASDPEYKYGAMRIKEISAQGVELQLSAIAYNKTSGVQEDIDANKASVDTYYEDKTLQIDIAKLKGFKDSGVIYSVKRN